MLLAVVFLSFKDDTTTELKIGEKSPLTDYGMVNCTGEKLSLESTMGKKGLLVIFSCNTCPFVVGNADFKGWEIQYNELYEFAKKHEMGLILVNSNAAKRENVDSQEEMMNHWKKMNYKMPYLLDDNALLADAYGAKTTPHAYLLDSDFILRYKGSIDNSWDSKRKNDISYVRNAIAEVSQNKAVTLSESTPKGCSIKRIL